MVWEERYGQNRKPTRCPMDRKALDGFGFEFREFFDGFIDVDIEAFRRRFEIAEVVVDLRLDDAELGFGDIWSKSTGELGLPSASVMRSAAGVSIDRMSMEAPGLHLSGTARFRPDMALEQAKLHHIAIDGLIDGELTLSRDDERQRLAIDATSSQLNITSWIQQALKSVGREASNLPLLVDAAYDEIILSPGYTLESGALTYRHSANPVASRNPARRTVCDQLGRDIGYAEQAGPFIDFRCIKRHVESDGSGIDRRRRSNDHSWVA